MRSKILLSLFIIGFCLLAGELVLRCWFPLYLADYYQAYRYDPETGYRPKNSLRILKTTNYQQELLTDKDGVVGFPEKIKKYKKLIFAVGDSFTQGVGVPADASYPFQLQLLLNGKDGHYEPNYAVVNQGVAGYGTEQELLRLQRLAKELGDPQYILLLVAENDYMDDQSFRRGNWQKKMIEGNPNYPQFIIRTIMWLKYDFEIGKRLILLGNNLGRDNVGKKILKNQHKVNYTQRQEQVLQKFIQAARQMHATLIVSWIPCFFANKIPQDYAWLKGYAAQNKIAFADWYPAVLSIMQGIPNVQVNNPHSGGHYRTWVNQVIAQAYAKHIN
jgi:lysophospholipase L1-like esterase